jgi:cytochrome c oxidase assembly factor CtaG
MIVVALCSPLELLSELSFTAHMVQHQLLVMGAPPLLLLGAPFPVILWALPFRLRRRVGGLLTRPGPIRRGATLLTWMPVAGALSTLTLWGWHYPAAYEAALAWPVLHDVEHLTFFGTATLFWWPVVNPAPRFRRLTSGVMYGARIGYLILATAQNTLLGAVLGLAERVYYASYAAAPRLLLDWSALDDQAFGGGVMWSGSHMYLVAVLVLLHRAMDAEGRRADARARPIV